MSFPHAARAARPDRRGLSLLDLVVAMTVLVIAGGAVTTGLVATRSLSSQQQERKRAIEAAVSIVEELKSVAFDEAFARYNGTAADDPASGVSPGSNFEVEGLGAMDADADGIVGRIEFPGSATELREDDNDAGLGMPRDLNNDAATDNANHGGDYVILPVRVVVEWEGDSGEESFELITVLSDL